MFFKKSPLSNSTPECFKQIPSNPLYQQYLKTNPEIPEEDWEKEYQWKYFLLKKYFKFQIFQCFIIALASLFILILSLIFIKGFRRFPGGGLIITLILTCAMVFILSGIIFGFTYIKMHKQHRRYIWKERTRLSWAMEKYFMETYF